MNKPISLKKIVEHPYFGPGCFVAILFVLPRYGAAAMMIGCALVLAAYLAVNPDRFRNRSGSLTVAVCLVTAMWMGAAALVWLSLIKVTDTPATDLPVGFRAEVTRQLEIAGVPAEILERNDE